MAQARCRLLQSTGEDLIALNLFESVLHLTQGQMIVSYVIADSMVQILSPLFRSASTLKKMGAVT